MNLRRSLAVALTAAAASLSLVSTASAAEPTQFTIGTHNTLHGTSNYSAFANIIGWQELDNATGINKMKAALGSGYAHCIPSGVAEEDTISWNASLFTGGYCGARLTHKGEAGVTPNRYVVYESLTVKATGVRFAFVNTHFISGAFSGHPERQARWNTHLKVLQQLVSELQAKGLPVVVVGDMNRQAALPLSGLSRFVNTGHPASDVPLDQLYAPTANKVGTAVTLAKNGSDHYAYRASVSI